VIDYTVFATVPVVDEPEGIVLLCVHEPDVDALCAGWSGKTVVTFQNGVRAEELAARHCDAIGGVWRTTCRLIEPGRAWFTRRGRVIVGRADPAADLRRAGFDVGVSEDFAADRWLKLFVNLTSAPNALVRRDDHRRPEFGALKAALLEEARAVFATAGITARSCDGRDASMEEEIERQRRIGRRERPVFNGIWRQLSRGRRPKELYHDTLLELSADAPRNASMLELLTKATEPECYTVEECA